MGAKVGDMAKSTAQEKRTRTKVGRASRSLGQSWQVPIFLVGTLIFGIVAASAPLRRDSEAYQFSCDLHQLREALTSEDAELDPLSFTAESLLLRQAKYPEHSGEVEHLVGSLYQRRAQHKSADEAKELYAQAIKHLQRSISVGAQNRDQPVLLFQLGQCFYESGDLPSAIDHLKQSIAKNYERRAAAYGLLVQAYLNLPEPDLEAALATNQKQLLEFSDEESLASARLARGQILIKKGDCEEAWKILERINALAPKAIVAEARYLQTQCCEKEGWWDKAVPIWQELLEEPGKVPGGRGRVLYSIGVAHRHTGAHGARAAEKAWLEAIKLGGDTAQAAGLRLGELYLLDQKADAAAALKIWSQVLVGTKSATEYQNKYIELTEARQIFDDAFGVLARSGDFASAQELALLYQRLAVSGEADEKLADATAALARNIIEKAGGPDADIQRQQAKILFEKAALAYEQAGIVLPAERQPRALWCSAQCLIQAGDSSRAVEVLRNFLKLPTNDADLTAQAWLALGQSYQALNQRENARNAYFKCIELPTTSAYQARYQIAEEQMQLGELEKAIDNLQHCLSLLPPSQDSVMREKSLYKLANALYLHKDYDKAQHRLKEAWLAFPNNPEALTARDRLGECYRKLAERARDNAKVTKSEDTKSHYLTEMRDWLGQSLTTYLVLMQDLEHKVISEPEEEKLLRKAAFMAADLHYELGNYVEALQRYQDLQKRHRKQFAGLVACLRVWRCLGVMVSPDQAPLAQQAARDALTLAHQDLAEMPADHEAFRDRPGGWGKQEWQDWVTRTREQLRPTPTAAATPPPTSAPPPQAAPTLPPATTPPQSAPTLPPLPN